MKELSEKFSLVGRGYSEAFKQITALSVRYIIL